MKSCLLMLIVSAVMVNSQNEELLEGLEKTVCSLARQLMLQQLFVEERIRSDGSSGLKQVRITTGGTRPYYFPTHTYNSVSSIHDHSNNKYTVGMGEVIPVMNGVEFRTRHNDYKLKRPSTTSTNYHETEYIDLPAVPPSVSAKTSVADQIAEMREYFKAWKDEDISHRDYTPYFKPALCYMEGAWTTATDTLDESFDSDRHLLEAKTWFEMQEKIRYTSITGTKNVAENFAFLPTTIMNVTEDCLPVYAQWNYRILCHPIERELKVNMLKVADDLATRLAHKWTIDDLPNKRAARFRVNGKDGPYTKESSYNYGLLDELMYEIPGKGNYPQVLNDTSFGLLAYRMDAKENILNAARYHRIFRHGEFGAMGIQKRHRGFADENLFVALNDQTQVSPISVTQCDGEECETYTARASYAIPLEIIFMTPLMTWNPYGIEYKEGQDAKTVIAGGRNGASEATAYNGTRFNIYYQTPKEFFQGSEVDTDPADTVKGVAWVLDGSGTAREVVASATRIFLPEINGIGTLRTRYPIPPIHGEGRAVWKEMDAIKEVLNNLDEYGFILEQTPACLDNTGSGTVQLYLGPSILNPHTHVITISQDKLNLIKAGATEIMETTMVMNHQHNIEIAYDQAGDNYYIYKCDGNAQCFDQHPQELSLVPT